MTASSYFVNNTLERFFVPLLPVFYDNDFSNLKHWNNLRKMKMNLPKAHVDEFGFLVRTDLEKFSLT